MSFLSDPLALPNGRRATPAGILLVGLLVTLAVGLPTAHVFLREYRPERVVACYTGYSHGFVAKLRMESGDELELSTRDVEWLRQCPKPGTVIEKRAFEWGWRMDGQYWPPHQDTIRATCVITAVGLCVVVLGTVLWIRERSKQRPD